MASVRERVSASGERSWSVLFRRGGKQQSKTFADRTSAERFVTRIDLDGIDAALGSLKPQPRVSLTFDDVAARWLAARAIDVEAGSLTPRVLTGYARDYYNWVSPWLGHLDAEGITELTVQNWIDRIKVMPRSSPKSIAARHAIAHGIFKWAANPRRGIIRLDHNPCIGTELPAQTRKPPKGLRLPELNALTATARQVNPDGADLIDFIIGTGWRLGEAIALTVGQVEDDGIAVYVTVSRVWRREVGFVQDAKSEAGLRRLRVLGDAVGVLRRRVIGRGPGDLVFLTDKNRPWDESGFRRDHFNKIARQAGLVGERRPTPHWLRHSHVYVCHAAGMDLAQIQRRLGHKDIKMTINTYGRMIDDMTEDVAARLDALLTTRPASELVIPGSVVPEID